MAPKRAVKKKTAESSGRAAHSTAPKRKRVDGVKGQKHKQTKTAVKAKGKSQPRVAKAPKRAVTKKGNLRNVESNNAKRRPVAGRGKQPKGGNKKSAELQGSEAVQGAGRHYKVREHLTDESWRQVLQGEFDKPYFKNLEASLEQEAQAGMEIFPPQELVFNAFNLTPFDKVKLVIVGQDPYHDNGQAHGLAFSVPAGVPAPPSLKNVYKELATDVPGFVPPTHGNLEKWAAQGVLLLNAALTVRAHSPNSHGQFGWQTFTDAVIRALAARPEGGIVFLLWGGFAQKKGHLVATAATESKASLIQQAQSPEAASSYKIIATAHPSPLSVHKFRGCKCFSQVNTWLQHFGREPVDWSL